MDQEAARQMLWLTFVLLVAGVGGGFTLMWLSWRDRRVARAAEVDAQLRSLVASFTADLGEFEGQLRASRDRSLRLLENLANGHHPKDAA